MRKMKEYFFVALFGAAGYSLMEICWRGYTHWTMALVGGFALLGIYLMDSAMQTCGFLQKCTVGCVLITVLELIAGAVVNLALGWQVWDYSQEPGNLFGQICPLYSVLWFILCMALIPLCAWIRRELAWTPTKQTG